MKIGLLIDDRGFSNIHFEKIETGNPGVGGTWYEFALVSTLLKRMRPDYQIYILHFNDTNSFHQSLDSIIIEKDLDSIEFAANSGIDYLVYRAGKSNSWYLYLAEKNVRAVAWAHNFLLRDEIYRLADSSMVKRVVFVGEEQYDCYIDEDIVKKSTFIYNIVEKTDTRLRKTISHDVTFIGSIVPAKGFHVVAKAWKKILQSCPDAQLNIIGSGQLYDSDNEMGEYGLAEKKYESTFIGGITDDNGKLLNSVHFHGILADEKNDIILKTSVGVVNPTCESETFCIGAVEFEQFGVPVCSGRKYGLLDTVDNKKTGLLSLNSREFAQNIVILLNDEELNKKYGEQAVKKANSFSAAVIMPYWTRLFEDIEVENKCTLIIPNRMSVVKLLRLLSYFIRIKVGLSFFPTVDEIVNAIKRPLVRIKHLIFN